MSGSSPHPPGPLLALGLDLRRLQDQHRGHARAIRGWSLEAIGIFSKNLPEDKRRWTTFRRELLSVKDGIRHFINEIDGRELIVFTDHRPLVSAFHSNSMKHDVIAQNHIQEVSLWTNDVRFLAGRANNVADRLSRPSHVPMGGAYMLNHLDALEVEQNIYDTHARHLSDRQTAAVNRPDAPSTFHSVSALEGETLNNVALNIVDNSKLMEAQQTCPDVAHHRKGLHPKTLNMVDFEFSPGVILYCDLSDGKKARPLVPQAFRKDIIRMFHCLNHNGQ